MTRRESYWITVLIIALVMILRAPTLLPSLCLTDEGYYGTIANDVLDGGKVYHTAVDTKPPGIYYIYAGVFRVAGRNNLLAVHLLAIFVVIATALAVRRIGARVFDEWAGAWGGIAYAVFVHAYLPRDTLAANTEIFASLFLSLSILAFLRGEKHAVWVWMFLSCIRIHRTFRCRKSTTCRSSFLIDLGADPPDARADVQKHCRTTPSGSL